MTHCCHCPGPDDPRHDEIVGSPADEAACAFYENPENMILGRGEHMIHVGDRVTNRDNHKKPHAINRLDKQMHLSYHGTVKDLDGNRALVQWGNGVIAWIDARKLLPDHPGEQAE